LSGGTADVACIISPSTALADAAATAFGNRIKGRESLTRAANWVRGFNGITGGLAIVDGHMATWGEIELVSLF
jgi:ApbE superfamily uncharacterized protein (UPF0280 family)